MNSRLNQLGDEQLVSTLLDARANLDELKNRQFTSGKSGVLGYLTTTANTWDFNASMTGSLISGLTATWTITYSGDGSQQFPMENFFIDVFVNSPIEANRLSLFKSYWYDGTNTVSSEIKPDYVAIPLTDPLRFRWVLTVNVYGTATVMWKVNLVGSSPGTLTIVRTV